MKILIILFLTSNLFADSPAPPESYAVLSHDQKYILVILAPEPYDSSSPLRQKYSVSGLYENNGSVSPLWTLPSDFCCPQVDVFNDAKHIVAWNAWPEDYGTFDQTVAWFHENGKEIRNYKIQQLVDHPQHLRHSVSHYTWIDKTKVDDKLNRITLWTLNGQIITFDRRTGDVISRSRTFKYYQSFLTAGVILLFFIAILLTVVMIIKRLRSKYRTTS
jgi:hypothetical protein